jgi:hypothetical protein
MKMPIPKKILSAYFATQLACTIAVYTPPTKGFDAA